MTTPRWRASYYVVESMNTLCQLCKSFTGMVQYHVQKSSYGTLEDYGTWGINAPNSPQLTACKNADMTWRTAVSVEWLGQKPDCNVGRWYRRRRYIGHQLANNDALQKLWYNRGTAGLDIWFTCLAKKPMVRDCERWSSSISFNPFSSSYPNIIYPILASLYLFQQ